MHTYIHSLHTLHTYLRNIITRRLLTTFSWGPKGLSSKGAQSAPSVEGPGGPPGRTAASGARRPPGPILRYNMWIFGLVDQWIIF